MDTKDIRRLLRTQGRRTYKAKLWVKKAVAAGQNPVVIIKPDGTTAMYCEVPPVDEYGPYLTQMCSLAAVKKELIRQDRCQWWRPVEVREAVAA
jgi:hypothetical protein